MTRLGDRMHASRTSLARAVPLGVLCALAGAGSGSLARAQGTELTWTGPEECMPRAAFERAFAAALGTPLDDLAAPGTRVQVRFAEGSPWRVTVEVLLEAATRTRTLSVEGGCRALDEGLIVVVALLVDEVAADAGEAQSAPSSPTIASRPISSRPIALGTGEAPPAASEAPPAPAPSMRGAIALGVLGRFDALPGLVFGPLLATEVRVADIVTIGVMAAYFPPATTRREDGVAAEVSALGGAANSCVLGAPADFFEIGGCGSVGVFLVTAAGSGLDQVRRGEGIEVAAVLEGRGSVRLAGPLWLRIHVGLGLAMVRSRITYEVMGMTQSLHLTSLAFPTASALLELRLGE